MIESLAACVEQMVNWKSPCCDWPTPMPFAKPSECRALRLLGYTSRRGTCAVVVTLGTALAGEAATTGVEGLNAQPCVPDVLRGGELANAQPWLERDFVHDEALGHKGPRQPVSIAALHFGAAASVPDRGEEVVKAAERLRRKCWRSGLTVHQQEHVVCRHDVMENRTGAGDRCGNAGLLNRDHRQGAMYGLQRGRQVDGRG